MSQAGIDVEDIILSIDGHPILGKQDMVVCEIDTCILLSTLATRTGTLEWSFL